MVLCPEHRVRRQADADDGYLYGWGLGTKSECSHRAQPKKCSAERLTIQEQTK